jgi:hypothetical protein
MTVVALVTTLLAILFGVMWRLAETENTTLRAEVADFAEREAARKQTDRAAFGIVELDADAIMAARLDAHNEHVTFGAFGRRES